MSPEAIDHFIIGFAILGIAMLGFLCMALFT